MSGFFVTLGPFPLGGRLFSAGKAVLFLRKEALPVDVPTRTVINVDNMTARLVCTMDGSTQGSYVHPVYTLVGGGRVYHGGYIRV